MSVCSNCGRNGHFFRECKDPILSLGILAYNRANTGIQFLLVRRRVSIGFIELMRGKFEPRDTDGIQVLVDQATLSERQMLLTQSFTDLWLFLWNGPASRRYQTEYDQSKSKFDVLRRSGTLADLCLKSKTSWIEPEWGFPKGRRSSTETELACALRETVEEAGVFRQDLTIRADLAPLLEEYQGSNGVQYRYKYWIAEMPVGTHVGMDATNVDQNREISDVRWCSLDEASRLIRPYNVEKLAVLRAAFSVV